MRYKLFITLILTFYIELATAQTEIKLMDYFRELKTVEVNIDGENYNFLFDTGGGVTVVSPQIIEKLNKEPYGYDVGFRMSGERVAFERCDSVTLAMGGIRFHQEEVAVFDLTGLLPKELKRVDGVVSLKTFERNEITLDFNNNRITIETEESFEAKTKQMTEVESRFANGLAGDDLNIFLALKANGKKWWFLFDCGNIADMKISKTIASSWKSYVPDDTTMTIFTYHFGGKARDSNMYIDDIIYDGALNYDFLQSHQFAISLKHNQVFISKQ
jgi:predicted aspartyl protease